MWRKNIKNIKKINQRLEKINSQSVNWIEELF